MLNSLSNFVNSEHEKYLCNVVAFQGRGKPVTREKTAVICGFEVCSRVLSFVVIGYYTISITLLKY